MREAYQTFQKGAGKYSLAYPVMQDQIDTMGTTALVSIRAGHSGGLALPDGLCNNTGLHASATEIAVVRELVKQGTFPGEFMRKYYPSEWGNFPEEIPEMLAAEGLSFADPEGLANVVHMDLPIMLGQAMLRWLISQGAKPRYTLNAHTGFDFVTTASHELSALADEITEALEVAFRAKYFFGVPRPEEVLDNPNMTHYPEGCPNHPSYPAGHGAFSFATGRFFARRWRLDGNPLPREMMKAIFDACYIWAMARSLAGVHHAKDNLAYAYKVGDMELTPIKLAA